MGFTAYSLVSLVLLLLLAWNAKTLCAQLKSIHKRTWIVLACFLIAVFVACWILVPNTHRTFGDEPNVLSKVDNIKDQYSTINIQMYLYYFLYTFVEADNVLLIKANIILSILCLLVLFLFIHVLFRNELVALATVVVLGIFPPFIVESTTAYTTIISLFFGLLACFCFWISLESGRTSLLAASLIAACFAVTCRIEYLVLYPVFLGSLVINFLYQKRKKWLVFALALVTYGAVSLLLFFQFIFENLNNKRLLWQELQTLDFGIAYIPITLQKYFLPQAFAMMLLFSFLLFISWFWISRQNKHQQSLFLLASVMLFNLFYLCNSYYAQRFMIVGVAFGSFVVGIALHIILTRFDKKMRSVLVGALLIFVLLSLRSTIIDANKQAEDNSYVYLTTAAPKILHQYINGSCLIVTSYSPNLAMAYNLTVMDAWQANKTENIFETYGCIYFFEDYLCEYIAEYTGMKEECDAIKQRFQLIPELIISDGKHREYVLYRMYDKNDSGSYSQNLTYAYPLVGMRALKSTLHRI